MIIIIIIIIIIILFSSDFDFTQIHLCVNPISMQTMKYYCCLLIFQYIDSVLRKLSKYVALTEYNRKDNNIKYIYIY